MTKFLITTLITGLLMGLAFAGTDLLNPHTAAAEANRVNIEAAHQQAVYELQERLSAAQTEAEIREIQRQQGLLDAQYQHNIQVLSQDLAHQDLAFRTWMTVLTIIGSALALTLFISTIIWVGSRAVVHIRSVPLKEELMKQSVPTVEMGIPNLSEREPYDPLDPKSILYANRLNQRLKELEAKHGSLSKEELLAARMKALSNHANIDTKDARWYFE
jgi:hypothetical protein